MSDFDFQPDTYYHVKWRFPNGAGPLSVAGGSFYGVYKWNRGGEPTFWQPARSRYTALTHGKEVVEATPLTEAEAMDRIAITDLVLIAKYGSTYNGVIVGKKRTRVCVAFRTVGGKDKEQYFHIFDVEPVK